MATIKAENQSLQTQIAELREMIRAQVSKQKWHCDAESQRLVSALGVAGNPLGAVAQRLGEIEAEVATLTQRMTVLDGETAFLRATTVDLDPVAATLADFDGLWDVLIPAERFRLVHLLVERVEHSGRSERIKIIFRSERTEHGCSETKNSDRCVRLLS